MRGSSTGWTAEKRRTPPGTGKGFRGRFEWSVPGKEPARAGEQHRKRFLLPAAKGPGIVVIPGPSIQLRAWIRFCPMGERRRERRGKRRIRSYFPWETVNSE